jgi:hypothetical protein
MPQRACTRRAHARRHARTIAVSAGPAGDVLPKDDSDGIGEIAENDGGGGCSGGGGGCGGGILRVALIDGDVAVHVHRCPTPTPPT